MNDQDQRQLSSEPVEQPSILPWESVVGAVIEYGVIAGIVGFTYFAIPHVGLKGIFELSDYIQLPQPWQLWVFSAPLALNAAYLLFRLFKFTVQLSWQESFVTPRIALEYAKMFRKYQFPEPQFLESSPEHYLGRIAFEPTVSEEGRFVAALLCGGISGQQSFMHKQIVTAMFRDAMKRYTMGRHLEQVPIPGIDPWK